MSLDGLRGDQDLAAPPASEAGADADDEAATTADGAIASTEGGPAGTDAGVDGEEACSGAACPRFVFVTSAAFFAKNLNGLAGADTKCNMAAIGGSPKLAGRTFKAWLGDETTSATIRLVHGTGRYRLLDGTMLGSDWLDMVDGAIASSISIDESGNYMPGLNVVWTGTQLDGTSTGSTTCGSWTSDTGTATTGRTSLTDSKWTNFALEPCGLTGHLYCFEK